MYSTRFSCQILMKLEHSLQTSHKSKFMKIRPVGAELFRADGWTDGRSDRHDEAYSRFSKFCERT
jgi:hypothetical protein